MSLNQDFANKIVFSSEPTIFYRTWTKLPMFIPTKSKREFIFGYYHSMTPSSPCSNDFMPEKWGYRRELTEYMIARCLIQYNSESPLSPIEYISSVKGLSQFTRKYMDLQAFPKPHLPKGHPKMLNCIIYMPMYECIVNL